MTPHRHFVIIFGRWKFYNWHLYCYREHHNAKGNVRWAMWDRVL
jgi:hypothetical protein